MSVNTHIKARTLALKAEAGFTMIIAIMVMFVASLLMVAAFTAANGDIHPAHADLTQKQAYYAALAGVQEFEYKLQSNPNYWQSCPSPKGEVPGEKNETYEVTVLSASTNPEASKTCNSSNPFQSIIESKGALTNTFRIKSVGKSEKSKRAVVANFQVAGFLNYIYFTQYEVQDPSAREGSTEEEELCANYRPLRKSLGVLEKCGTIVFGPEDTENGPLHTDDAGVVCGGAEFGRAKHEPADAIEFNKEAVSAGCGSGGAIYNTATGGPTVGPELVAPKTSGSLKTYVEHEPQQNEIAGRTYLVLEGTLGQIKVTTVSEGVETTKTMSWPNNGLIYVTHGSGGCEYTKFDQENTDTNATLLSEEGCGSVYVKGNYKESLTIAAEQDIIINGNITPSSITPPASAPGTATLGLIATRFVRIYHPCTGGSGNGAGSLSNPYIYAAILSTSHSFLVDNYQCGKLLGNLTIIGAIAQKFRGIVGRVGSSGYNKEYIYDERLATDEPPYFLTPLKAGWKIARETAIEKG